MVFKKVVQAVKRLHWKLTLSYTTVTLGALVLTILILGLVFFSFILAPHEFIPQAFWVEVFMQNISPAWRYVLAQDSIDLTLLNLMLQEGFGEDQDLQVSYFNLFRIRDLQLTVRMMGRGSILVVSPDYLLMGSSNPDWVSTDSIGDPLDLSLLPGLAGPVDSALSGNTRPEPIFRDIQPFDQFYFVVPIFENPDLQADVLAAAVIYIESLPTESDITENLTTLILRSSLIFLLAASLIGTLFGFLTARGMVKRLANISDRTEAWSHGDFTNFIQDTVGDEISQLAERLNHMAKQLQKYFRTSQELAVSEERNRMARDLHDSAKQEALAASFHLGTALTLFDRDPQSAKNHLNEANNLVDSVRRELTDLIHELRPPSMNGDNFIDTIREYIMEWAHQTGIKAGFQGAGTETLPMEVKLSLYRILQEALANTARHSSAEKVNVLLEHSGEKLRLIVQDDGVGFDPDQWFEGIGLESMRERAEALGGRFVLTSTKNKGTRICVELPNPVTRK